MCSRCGEVFCEVCHEAHWQEHHQESQPPDSRTRTSLRKKEEKIERERKRAEKLEPGEGDGPRNYEEAAEPIYDPESAEYKEALAGIWLNLGS